MSCLFENLYYFQDRFWAITLDRNSTYPPATPADYAMLHLGSKYGYPDPPRFKAFRHEKRLQHFLSEIAKPHEVAQLVVYSHPLYESNMGHRPPPQQAPLHAYHCGQAMGCGTRYGRPMRPCISLG